MFLDTSVQVFSGGTSEYRKPTAWSKKIAKDGC